MKRRLSVHLTEINGLSIIESNVRPTYKGDKVQYKGVNAYKAIEIAPKSNHNTSTRNDNTNNDPTEVMVSLLEEIDPDTISIRDKKCIEIYYTFFMTVSIRYIIATDISSPHSKEIWVYNDDILHMIKYTKYSSISHYYTRLSTLNTALYSIDLCLKYISSDDPILEGITYRYEYSIDMLACKIYNNSHVLSSRIYLHESRGYSILYSKAYDDEITIYLSSALWSSILQLPHWIHISKLKSLILEDNVCIIPSSTKSEIDKLNNVVIDDLLMLNQQRVSSTKKTRRLY